MRALLVLAVAGCGGGSSASVPLEMLGTQVAQTECTRIFACCTDAEIKTIGSSGIGNFTDETGCEQTESGFIMGFLYTPISSSVTMGRVVYHGDKLGACLSRIRAESCADFSTQYMASRSSTGGPSFGSSDADCTGWLEPKVAAGGACRADWECMASTKCVGGSTGGFGQPAKDGACAAPAPPPKAGDPCQPPGANFNGCGDGLYCDYSAMAMTCRALVADGAACSYSQQCASGHCDTSQQMPVCGARLADGQPCMTASDCQSGNCAASGGMAACAAKKPDGQPCMQDSECAGGSCSHNGQTATCVTPTPIVCKGR